MRRYLRRRHYAADDMAYPFAAIESKHQQAWRDGKVYAAADPANTSKPPFYVLDMFPYPSGAGLHVGHPEGYTATDIVSRYKRMRGFNVLHPMGWDAFGLPAEQYAIKNNVHPAETTAKNVATFRRQIEMLGLGYDWDREVNTTDPDYYRWTQWIFLQIYNSYFDPIEQKAMPIEHLENELFNANYVVAPDMSIVLNPVQEGLEAVAGEAHMFRNFKTLDKEEQRLVIDNQRLAFVDEVPVNWCPALGTTLANEEVVDGKSEVGGHPVEKRPLRQWMLRITAYADRLLEDLDTLDWSDSLKDMQRNWIGKSVGATVEFDLRDHDDSIEVYTTRPDTLFGATYMVLAPEHDLVSRITTTDQKAAVDAYVAQAAGRSERDRQADAKEKTGVFTGGYALNPVNDEPIPVWVADYVLTGYGTGAIMAVPAHDERDFSFATKFDLPITRVVDGGELPFTGDGKAVNSEFLDGKPMAEAKAAMIDYLRDKGVGRPRTNYKLRDWLFSRQRYWGEPFPILIDADGNHHAVDESELPVTLPELEDFKPTGSPEGPLAKATDWLTVERDGQTFRRETNTMPQWAGSCWYYLRYLDPHNKDRFVDPAKEAYWMPVELYVGGVEHAVLHLLYARFWHKVLFDLGHLSTSEPFQRLVNQGMILGEAEYTAFKDEQDAWVSYYDVTRVGDQLVKTQAKQTWIDDDGAVQQGRQTVTPLEIVKEVKVSREDVELGTPQPTLKDASDVVVIEKSHKMSKSRGNVINPDDVVSEYGADTFRLYEMYMGPLEAMKPWNTRDIVGMSRFLSKVHRTMIGITPTGDELPDELDRKMNKAIANVAAHVEALRFNTAIAELIELINLAARFDTLPRTFVRVYALLLGPFAPHLAEEIWQTTLGMETSIVVAGWPDVDESKLVDDQIELPVQVNGKLRGRISVAPDAPQDEVLAHAKAEVADHLADKTIRKEIVVPGRMVNLVVG
jgi:leucyl-tRNA synthetase